MTPVFWKGCIIFISYKMLSVAHTYVTQSKHIRINQTETNRDQRHAMWIKFS